MPWLIVTPARNEAARLPRLAASLAAQDPNMIGLWVVVDDGSTDDTALIAADLDLPFETLVIRRENDGGLGAASELLAFRAGAAAGLSRLPGPDRIMKCDADIELDPGYLAALADLPEDVGLCGGRVRGMAEVEQSTYVLGALKAYTLAGYVAALELPAVLGWDVADEVALRLAGMRVQVVLTATARTTRRTGSSEGILEGRRRNGTLSRWLGYHPVYFALRLLRFAFRKPFGLSALALLQGYVTAGPSPYDPSIRTAFRAGQSEKLHALARHPLRWLRATYARV